MPERLVQSHQAEYFDFFYDLLAVDPSKLTPDLRAAQVHAYATNGSLTAGFNWYRAFDRDARENAGPEAGSELTTPLLYLRGDRERGGAFDAYIKGLEAAGARGLTYATVPETRHFSPNEAPAETWRLVSAFARDAGSIPQVRLRT